MPFSVNIIPQRTMLVKHLFYLLVKGPFAHTSFLLFCCFSPARRGFLEELFVCLTCDSKGSLFTFLGFCDTLFPKESDCCPAGIVPDPLTEFETFFFVSAFFKNAGYPGKTQK